MGVLLENNSGGFDFKDRKDITDENPSRLLGEASKELPEELMKYDNYIYSFEVQHVCRQHMNVACVCVTGWFAGYSIQPLLGFCYPQNGGPRVAVATQYSTIIS